MSTLQFLFKAIMVKWSASAALVALVPVARVFQSSAARGATYPLVIFHQLGADPQWAYAGIADPLIEYTIQFSVYDDAASCATANQIAREITNAFDGAALNYDGQAGQVSIYYLTERCIRDEADLWHHSLDYEISLAKP